MSSEIWEMSSELTPSLNASNMMLPRLNVQNRFQTLPNLSTTPGNANHLFQHLQQTQGAEENAFQLMMFETESAIQLAHCFLCSCLTSNPLSLKLSWDRELSPQLPVCFPTKAMNTFLKQLSNVRNAKMPLLFDFINVVSESMLD